MMNWIKNLTISVVITVAVVIGNWYWCVLIDHWNPSNMSLDWPAVIVMAIVNWVLVSAVAAGIRKIRRGKVRYITMAL